MRSSAISWIVLALLSAALPSYAHAKITLNRVGDGPSKVLVVEGEFELSDDPSLLAAAVVDFHPSIISFASNGGNVVAAMKYGRMIRALGLHTVQLRSTQCVSACALAFVGGAQRQAEPGSIGVHRSSFAEGIAMDSQTAVAAIQSATADIIAYLVEMGVSPQLLQLSLSVDSTDMRYLTASEMTQFAVTSGGAVAGTVSTQVAVAPVQPPPSAPASSEPERDPRARALSAVGLYYAAWSRPNGPALSFLQGAYSDPIQFYGKAVRRDDVLREKAIFAARWPVRAYSVKHGSEQVICAQTCLVTAIVEWFTLSAERAKTSSGAAEFMLSWNPYTDKFESESGRVIGTDRKAASPDRIISQWQDQNGECRGGRGDSAETMKACDRREVISAKLEGVGWCYGKKGQYGYQMEWHMCGPDSNR